MTNASALYFQDEFGQSTVSAAAIASVFGFMNLFARGLGGFGSDLFNAKYGMRGRMAWQALMLFLEGVAIVVFAYADTLPGSILALIFLSLMVQGAGTCVGCMNRNQSFAERPTDIFLTSLLLQRVQLLELFPMSTGGLQVCAVLLQLCWPNLSDKGP